MQTAHTTMENELIDCTCWDSILPQLEHNSEDDPSKLMGVSTTKCPANCATKTKKKKKQMTTNEDVEKFIKMSEWLQEKCEDDIDGKDWDDAMMAMAKKQKDIEDECTKKKTQDCKKKRFS